VSEREKNNIPPVLFAVSAVGGAVMIVLGPTLDAIIGEYGLSKTGGALLSTAYFFGSLLSIVAVNLVLGKRRADKVLALAAVLTGVGLAMIAGVGAYGVLLFSFALTGFGNIILTMLPGMVVIRLNSGRSQSALNILYSFYALGVLSGPIYAGLLQDAGISWRTVYLGLAICVAVLYLVVLYTKMPPIDDLADLDSKRMGELAQTRPALWGWLAVAMLLYVGAESAMNVWIPSYLLSSFPDGVSIGRASRVLTYFWVGMTLGRIGCGTLLARTRPCVVAAVLAVVSIGFQLAALLSGSLLTGEVFLALIGLAYSGIFPCLTSYAQDFPDRLSGSVFSLLVAAGMMGGVIVPLQVGAVADALGLRIAMLSVAVPVALMAVVVLVMRSRGMLEERIE